MQEPTVKIKTAILAKEKGFNEGTLKYFWSDGLKPLFVSDSTSKDRFHLQEHWVQETDNNEKAVTISLPTQSQLRKFIREKRGVHIIILRNASCWYWSMCKSDGGTDLGWSELDRDNGKWHGGWDSYEEALEYAMQVQLTTDLEKFGHWSNYAQRAIEKLELINPPQSEVQQ